MTTAIAEVETRKLIREASQLVVALNDAERRENATKQTHEHARDVAGRARLELGRYLSEVRPNWPARGPKAKGWGEFLSSIGVEQQRAWELMQLAGYVEEHGEISPPNAESGETRVPTLVEAGIRPAPYLELVPPHVEAEADAAAVDEVLAPIDRNSWCTPKWIADAIGYFDLDPCSNARSHIRSIERFLLENGQDGLALAGTVKASARVFLNTPYEGGQVIRWVRGYKHTRFCFLVRLDTSTEWFEELYAAAALICVPKRERIEFDPPPGVEASSNPFPHGLVYARAGDATPEIRERCYLWTINKTNGAA